MKIALALQIEKETAGLNPAASAGIFMLSGDREVMMNKRMVSI